VTAEISRRGRAAARKVRAAIVLASAAAFAAGTPVAAGPGWSLRLQSRFQMVGFRGATLDSIAREQVVSDPEGRLFTPEGFAVHCPPGPGSCTFYRPGRLREARPVHSTLRFAAWSLGVPGLSIRGSAQLATDLGPETWPETEPELRLLEGSAEWTRGFVTLRAGRLYETGRLAFQGYDGGSAETRFLDGRARAAVFGGFGLARASPLPATDPALDPLDEFLPKRRQHVAGGRAQWSSTATDARVAYLREVDPRAGDFVSERIDGDFGLSWRSLSLEVGGEYDLAFGEWGSADSELRCALEKRLRVAVGAQRYAPRFDLWTIWGAFSPVPYEALYGGVTISPRRRLDFEIRAKRWTFADTGANAPLSRTEDRGRRWELRGGWSADPWTIRASAVHEIGPGAGLRSASGEIDWRASEILELGLRGGILERPLEFRFDDAELWSIAGRLSWELAKTSRIEVEVLHVDELRDRPDAASFDWAQTRVALAFTIDLDSGLAGPSVPPSVLQIPERQVPR
jgi:hypothetical protein